MLNKILLLLSAVALAGGAYLGFTNRQSFIETRNEKIKINATQVKPTLDKITEEIGNVEKEIAIWKDATGSKEQKKVALENSQAKFSAETESLAKIGKEIEDKKGEVAKMEADLAAVLGSDTIDTITAKVDKLTQDIASLKTDADNAAKTLDIAQKKVADNEAVVAALDKASAQRNQGISLNSLEGTVIATNQDYGFAVINIGENRGVTGNSKLIVKRGDQRIGLLSISSIAANKTVADIVIDSLTSGYTVNPGDKVIFEKVQR